MTEEQQTKLDQEHGRLLVANEHYQWARKKLEDLMDVQMSIGTIDEKMTATSIQKELIARKRAIGLVKSWMELVEGLAIQHKFNQPPKEEVDYVVRFPDEPNKER